MYNFCTLFDTAYLSRGLVMYNSLKQHTDNFHLYIFAFDDLCYTMLSTLNLDNITVISLSMLENNDLTEAKKTRTRAEYCWTCTSSVIEYILVNYNTPDCTYLDADLFFFRSPSAIFDELKKSEKSVLITEHRYSTLSGYFEQKKAGRFCVQFITFTNNPESRHVLNIWKNQCLNWCFNKYEYGKFGDQKYLDEWPEKYENVHILNHQGGGVAPWNIRRYNIIEKNNSLYGIDLATNEQFNLIFFHFHFVRFQENGKVDLGWNYLSKKIKRIIYYPYILKIIETEKMLSDLNPEYRISFYKNSSRNFKEIFKSFLKSSSMFNILKIQDI